MVYFEERKGYCEQYVISSMLLLPLWLVQARVPGAQSGGAAELPSGAGARRRHRPQTRQARVIVNIVYRLNIKL